jgi:hypothetical protein
LRDRRLEIRRLDRQIGGLRAGGGGHQRDSGNSDFFHDAPEISNFR